MVDCCYFAPGPRLLSQPKRLSPLAGTKLYCLVTEAHAIFCISLDIFCRTNHVDMLGSRQLICTLHWPAWRWGNQTSDVLHPASCHASDRSTAANVRIKQSRSSSPKHHSMKLWPLGRSLVHRVTGRHRVSACRWTVFLFYSDQFSMHVTLIRTQS